TTKPSKCARSRKWKIFPRTCAAPPPVSTTWALELRLRLLAAIHLQPQFLARLEDGHALGGDLYRPARAWIAAVAGAALAPRAGGKAAQLDGAFAGERGGDFVEHDIDGVLDVLRLHRREFFLKLSDQFGSQHGPLPEDPTASSRGPRRLAVKAYGFEI